MPSAFGQFMKERWEKLGLHQAEFCRRVGKPAGWVQQIREGKKTPPLGEMATWANVLDLTGVDRQRFFDLAAVAHLPEEAQPRFLTLVDEAARRSGGGTDPKSEAKK
ncbi:MAG TPA: helix-turn-helix transcriptional regulator [Planctomycetota bacterium]|nr:helix-turn-helix transcriptional regulator [Planctomycetota bacterium]